MDTLIGQDDLATCMRVSSVFNNLTAPILYDHVVADSTKRLYEGAAGNDTKPAHPSIRNKVENLHMIKHLYLEYHSMEVQLPLREVLRLPEIGEMSAAEAWRLIGLEHPKFDAMRETTEMFKEAFMIFRGADEDGVPILKLDTLALASIRGEDPCWATPLPFDWEFGELVGLDVRELERDIREVQDMLPWIIVNLGVNHFCTHAAHGPLKLPTFAALPLKRDAKLLGEARARLASAKGDAAKSNVGQEALCRFSDASTKNAELTKEPIIINHFTDFRQICLMANAHVLHHYDTRAPALGMNGIVKTVLEPVGDALVKGYDHIRHESKITGTLDLCCDKVLQPRVDFYGPISADLPKRGKVKSKSRRALDCDDEIFGPTAAGFELNHMINAMLHFEVDVDWKPLCLARECQACGLAACS